MSGRVSLGGEELDLQEAITILEGNIAAARAAVIAPIAEELNATMREARDELVRRPRFDLVNSIQNFDGDKPELISKFFSTINDVGEMSDWGDNEKLKVVRLKLTGAALDFIQAQDQGSVNTFENLRTVLTERFSDKAPVHCFYQQLNMLQQRKGETIEAFADRVRVLNEKTIRVTASAEVNAALREEAERRALEVFLRGLSGKVGEQTRLKFPETLKIAITTAIAIDHLVDSSAPPERKVFKTSSPGEVTCFKCHKKGHMSKDCRQTPEHQSSFECWRCGKKGHKRADCRVQIDKNTDRNRQSGNDKGASGSANTTPRQ